MTKFCILISAVILILVGLFFAIGNERIGDVAKQETSISQSVCDEVVKATGLHPVNTYIDKPSAVVFSKDEWLSGFKMTVTEQVAKGPNFAGHFRFVSWGCGTSCISYAVIDSITGNRVPINNSEIVEDLSPKYDINSRLLIFNPKEDFGRFRGKTLKRIMEIDPFVSPTRGLEYYELIEEIDGRVWLHKLCTENALDGIYLTEN